MIVSRHRPTRVIISKKAIQNNIKEARKNLPIDSEIFIVVKANGYGHGAIEITKIANEYGDISGVCVATLDEGIELRESGIDLTILVLGIIDVTYLSLIIDYDLSITVDSVQTIKSMLEVKGKRDFQRPIKIHLKLDTGMGRLGFLDYSNLEKSIFLIEDNPSLFIFEGIFTHFSTADQKEDSYFQKQLVLFREMLSRLSYLPKYVHVSNSATVLWHDIDIGNMVRYGIALYGINPSGTLLPEPYPLEPALSLVSELVQVRKLPSDWGVSYGKTYTTDKEEWIGTVPIGYADGWSRNLQGFKVLINGNFCEIIGRICMDQLMVRLPKQYELGTKVVLIGKDGDQHITVQDVADYLKTINYEVMCSLSYRLPREYI